MLRVLDNNFQDLVRGGGVLVEEAGLTMEDLKARQRSSVGKRQFHAVGAAGTDCVGEHKAGRKGHGLTFLNSSSPHAGISIARNVLLQLVLGIMQI